MPGVFITGTSTGVGKTYIASRIARQLRQRNIKVIPRKPVESGCLRRGNELIPQDAVTLKQAADYTGTLSEVCRYRFEPPISPARAALLADTVLTIEQLAKSCRQHTKDGFVVVEGAGGFYSPLAEDGLNADLAVALQLPIILVADNRLGAINQVLLTTEAIQSRKLSLSAIVLTETEEVTNNEINNLADLRERLDRPVYSISFNRDGSDRLPDELIKLLINDTNNL